MDQIKLNLETHKLCRKCQTVKLKSEFGRRRDGLRPSCKSCISAYAKENYKKNGHKYYQKKNNPVGRPRKIQKEKFEDIESEELIEN